MRRSLMMALMSGLLSACGADVTAPVDPEVMVEVPTEVHAMLTEHGAECVLAPVFNKSVTWSHASFRVSFRPDVGQFIDGFRLNKMVEGEPVKFTNPTFTTFVISWEFVYVMEQYESVKGETKCMVPWHSVEIPLIGG